jgi:hypothetical protein
MHPLGAALEKSGITQAQLSEMVRALRLRRKNGRLLRLAQSTISHICHFERACPPELAEAIVAALRGRFELTAAELVFAKRPENGPRVVKKSKASAKKPRHHRAA